MGRKPGRPKTKVDDPGPEQEDLDVCDDVKPKGRHRDFYTGAAKYHIHADVQGLGFRHIRTLSSPLDDTIIRDNVYQFAATKGAYGKYRVKIQQLMTDGSHGAQRRMIIQVPAPIQAEQKTEPQTGETFFLREAVTELREFMKGQRDFMAGLAKKDPVWIGMLPVIVPVLSALVTGFMDLLKSVSLRPAPALNELIPLLQQLTQPAEPPEGPADKSDQTVELIKNLISIFAPQEGETADKIQKGLEILEQIKTEPKPSEG